MVTDTRIILSYAGSVLVCNDWQNNVLLQIVNAHTHRSGFVGEINSQIQYRSMLVF